MNPFDGPKTIFGSKPQTYAAGFSSKLDLEKSMEERPKKPDVRLLTLKIFVLHDVYAGQSGSDALAGRAARPTGG